MDILINDIEANVSAKVMYQGITPIGVTLILKVHTNGNRNQDFCNQLTKAFKRNFSGVMSELTNLNVFEIRVLQCKTELKAIDVMRSEGYGVVQRRPY